ncbi:MAG: hypothetical protein ACREIA_04025 [Opitutaceae bacterium]
MQREDGTRIDARGAHWSSFSWGCSKRDPTIADTTRNNYPIQFGADWIGAYPLRKDLYNYGNCPDPQPTTLYLIGGVIEGTQPLKTTWVQSKAANGGGVTLNALYSVIDGMRIHNIHDPFVPLQGNNFTIKNCWVSYSRDDAIENDGFAAGFGHFWKQGDPRNPKIELVNNVFFIPRPFPGCEAKRYNVIPEGLVHAEGNVVVWMGDGDYPFSHEGFEVLGGFEGMSYWEKAKAAWIARHPKVSRVKGDPGYDPVVHGKAEPPPSELLESFHEAGGKFDS